MLIANLHKKVFETQMYRRCRYCTLFQRYWENECN